MKLRVSVQLATAIRAPVVGEVSRDDSPSDSNHRVRDQTGTLFRPQGF
jgi:hypothetical protein